MVIILMGPAGSGKTTLGRVLAQAVGWTFIEGDDHHSAGNIAKLRAGQPLTDEDRQPWLASLRAAMTRRLERREHAVVACSALKQQYRDALSTGLHGVRFVYLQVPAHVLAARLADRRDHVASPALLTSQLADFEPPADALVVDGMLPPESLVTVIGRELGLATA
jgi:gluconokinase